MRPPPRAKVERSRGAGTPMNRSAERDSGGSSSVPRWSSDFSWKLKPAVSRAWSRDEQKSKQQREGEPKETSYWMLHHVTANPPRKDGRDNLGKGRNREGSHHA